MPFRLASLHPGHTYERLWNTIPANTERNENIIITSKQRFDVIITYVLRCAK